MTAEVNRLPIAPDTLLSRAVQSLRLRGELSWRGEINLVEDDRPLANLGVDSIEWVALILELETIGGLVLHNSELAGLASVGDLRRLLAAKGVSR